MTNINLSLPIDLVSYLYRLTKKVVKRFKKNCYKGNSFKNMFKLLL